MRERICDEWYAILFCANLLSMLAAAAAAAAAATNATSDTEPVDEVVCPAISVDSCSCYVFDDNVFLECPSTTIAALRKVLAAFAHVPVQSLSLYDLDKSTTTIKADDFPRPLLVRQLHISLSNINQLTDDSFRHIRDQLESLAIVSAKLRAVPRKMLPYLTALRVVSFEANEIAELPNYSFYGLRLVEINLKGNALTRIDENAFAGLEGTLELADLSANRLADFPTAAIRRLRQLATLRLAWNAIRAIPDDGYSLLESLHHVDLGSNQFVSIAEDAFRPLPHLRTLSLYNNAVEGVHRRAFASLALLESLDLSHNSLVHLDADTFSANVRLMTIDLSHNHVHRIDGLFTSLGELRQLFLGENNVLEVPCDAFANATALNVVHLQRNALRRFDARAFPTTGLKLRQLHLSENFVDRLAIETLASCADLDSLNLDGNAIVDLQPSVFTHAIRLRELRLNNNRISQILAGVFQPLDHLIQLHLQHNTISAIETGAFRTLRSLQHVDLRNNMLHELGDVFQPAAIALVSVQLDANQLVSLHVGTLTAQTSAETVSLSQNRLTRLELESFADLRMVRQLYVADNFVSDVEDETFAAMGALVVLNLNGNRLRAVSGATFAGLGALRELHLASNRLEVIADGAFVELVQLRLLNLTGNRLAALRAPLFYQNAPLERLLLRNCRLVVIERKLLSALRQLRELDLGANYLTDSAVGQLESDSLRVLDLSANNVTRLADGSLDGVPALRELFIDDGHLALVESKAFLRNADLETFSARGNRLCELPADVFRATRRLRRVTLDANCLTTMPYAIANVVSLRKLSVADNRLRDTVDVCALRSLRNLTELNVSRNAIIALSGFERCNFTHLVSLDLAANMLTALPSDAFRGAMSLRTIDLSSNRFARLPTVSINYRSAPSLERLVFENNPIDRIRDGGQPSSAPVTTSAFGASRLVLRELLVSGSTNLTAVSGADFEPFDRLVYLQLARNSIARIAPDTFQALASLVALDLGGNRIASLPPQRLRGLRRLKTLNLTRNALRTLDPFCEDLKALETLDVSYNRLVAIDRRTFHHLANLTELRLRGNRIAAVSADVFRPLVNLHTLDVAGNDLRSLPLDALRPLETRLRSLRVEENPLVCGCAQEEAWDWLRDHEKLMGSSWSESSGTDSPEDVDDDDMAESASATTNLRCEEPAELRGRPFLRTDPSTFCAAPLLVQLAVRDIRPFSVNVSWQASNHSHVGAYQIVYSVVSGSSDDNGDDSAPNVDQDETDEDDNGEEFYDGDARWAQLTSLSPNTRYSICVIGMGDVRGTKATDGGRNSSDDDSPDEGDDRPEKPAGGARWSRCVEARTLDGGRDQGKGGGREFSLLTRRLGLIIGSCMGCVVFVALVVVLVYMKVKKQRRSAKHQQPLPPEYLSYRHFSLQGCEQLAAHPPAISATGRH